MSGYQDHKICPKCGRNDLDPLAACDCGITAKTPTETAEPDLVAALKMVEQILIGENYGRDAPSKYDIDRARELVKGVRRKLATPPRPQPAADVRAEKRFPLLHGGSVPWSLVQPHEGQALKNHGQTLEQLAKRSGLDGCELICILADRPWPKSWFNGVPDEVEEIVRGVLALFSATAATRLPAGLSEAASAVLAERQRQVDVEGWNSDHDDLHDGGNLAIAAACYAMRANRVGGGTGIPKDWPWDEKWWKPKSQRYDLVRAAALLLAEIERLDRIAALATQEPK